MGMLLRAGVILAASVMALGGIIFLIRNGGTPANYRTFRGAQTPVRTVSGILALALHGNGRGLIQLAVLLMIATPVARVIFAVYAFVRERDWLYALISLTVLALLLYGLLFGA